MPTPDEHVARITGNKDLHIAMLCAEIDDLRDQINEAGKENERLSGLLAQHSTVKADEELILDSGRFD